MATLFFVIAVFILFGIKMYFLKRESILSFNAWVVCGILFLLSLAAIFYFDFLIERHMGLRGYGSVSWLYITASLLGLPFVLFGHRTDGLRALRIFVWIVLVPLLLISCLTAGHIDDKASKVFYEDGKYRIEKVNLAMQVIRLPKLAVKKGIIEKYYDINSDRRLDQTFVTRATVTEITPDSLQISFYHRYEKEEDFPNPLVTGLRIDR